MMGAGTSVPIPETTEVATQTAVRGTTLPGETARAWVRHARGSQAVARSAAAEKEREPEPPALGDESEWHREMLEYKPEEVKMMLELYRDKQEAIDRSSIRGVQAKRDLYNSLDKTSENGVVNVARPKLDINSLHRMNHPKGYLTKITSDYVGQHDEELTVHKGTMVKVLRNHKDGRYEVYTAGGFGLVPGKILAYIQYEPDIS